MEKYVKLSQMQKDYMNNDLKVGDREAIHKSWFLEDTIDFWRHDRMYSTLKPIAEFYKNSSWLSIGDGRFGLDSNRLKKKFDINIFPTDISDEMLQKGKEMGIVYEFGVENAESLSFGNDAFDVIFCKEAYHHFPRPMIGLYEMIRVAKEAVVLIEPLDSPARNISKKQYIMSTIKMVLGKFLKKDVRPFLPSDDDYIVAENYEQSGNFIYALSNKEINKLVHAMDLGGMAYYNFNDVYEQGVEFEKAEENNKMFSHIKNLIKEMDQTGNYSMTTTIIFKNKVDEKLRSEMTDFGFKFGIKGENPYLMKVS